MKLLPKILAATVIVTALLLAVTLSSCGEEESYLPPPSEPPEYVMTLYRETNPNNGYVHTEQTYDSEGRLTGTMTRGTYSYRYEYDDEGRLSRELSGNYIKEYEYDGNVCIGREYTRTPENEKRLDREYHETYDEQGRLVEKKVYRSSGEWVYTMTYIHTSGKDFICEEQYVDFAVEGGGEQDGLYRMEKAVYDEQSRVIATEEFGVDLYGSGRTENTYDDAGNLVETRHYDRKDFCWRTEKYTYDEQGRVLTYRQTYNGERALHPRSGAPNYVEPPATAYSRGRDYTYGDDGLLAEMTTVDSNGTPENVTVYTYDEFGNCIREELCSPDGELLKLTEREFVKRGTPEFVMTFYSSTRDGVILSEQTYDEYGTLLTSRDRTNAATYTYDNEGRLSYIERSWTADAAYIYDEVGRLVRIDEGSNGSTDYTYHADGTHTESETRYYDGVLSEQETRLCDAEGRVLESEQRLYYSGGRTSVTETVWEYDDEGREVLCKQYDADTGELLYDYRWVYTETDDSFITERYLFDELDLREAFYYDDAGRETVHDYETFDELNPYSLHIESTYDDWGNLVELKQYRDGEFEYAETHTCDVAGRILKTRIERGSPSWMQASLAPEYFHSGYDYTYDTQGRLIEKFTHNRRDGTESKRTTYTYDDHGNCILEETVTMNGKTHEKVEREFVRYGEAPSEN